MIRFNEENLNYIRRQCKLCNRAFYTNDKWLKIRGSICSSCFKKQIMTAGIEDEPVNIHCYCNRCGKKIVLPEKVWLKRGAICNDCYHRIHEED